MLKRTRGRTAMLRFISVLAIVLLLVPAAKGKEDLVDEVRKAIDRGIKRLRDAENGKGNWESRGYPKAGESALAMVALLNAGVKPDDPIIERGLKFLRDNDVAKGQQNTYVVGLEAMAFALAGKAEDKLRIQQCADWLVDSRSYQ